MLTRDAAITELFLELVAIPSPSGGELRLATLILEWLTGSGVAAEFDGTAEASASDAGNLIATVPGAEDAPTYLFVAHMDTVESGAESIRPRLGDDGVIRAESDTILGADNKSAVAAVMRTCLAAVALPAVSRPTVIAAFTCREEAGRMGASLLDLGGRRVDCAFCVDGSQPIGTVITRALGQSVFNVSIAGRSAHAAADPGAGVSAIGVAAEVVAALPLGRQPAGGSVSVAAIVGGTVVDWLSPRTLAALGVPEDADGVATLSAALAASPTNSVPDAAYLRGEVRGYTVEEIEASAGAIEEIVAAVSERHGAAYQWGRGRVVPPFPGAADSRALRAVRAAASGVPGVEVIEAEAHATLEANYLSEQFDVVAVASGGRDPHQTSESITTGELQALEALLTGIVELGAGAGNVAGAGAGA